MKRNQGFHFLSLLNWYQNNFHNFLEIVISLPKMFPLNCTSGTVNQKSPDKYFAKQTYFQKRVFLFR